jgi:P27 family predicted phage terminase small subunit
MTGRKPTPTARQIAEGDPRKLGKHKLLEKLANEPRATRGLPECPEHLEKRAREAWTFWAEELAGMDIDRRPDAMMLEGACVAYESAVWAYELLAKQGRIVVTARDKDGKATAVRPHPAVKISVESWAQLRAFAAEFGLSPASRMRLTVDSHEDVGELADILDLPRTPRPVLQ